jgi:formiminoglutamase
MIPPDPKWPTAADWLNGKSAPVDTCALALIGVPLHLASLNPSRCDLAPLEIRQALSSTSLYDFEFERDLREVSIRNLGDLPVAGLSPEDAFVPVLEGVSDALSIATCAVIVLGGDNSVTRPAFHALRQHYKKTALLTIDAHLDVRTLDGGLHNGNPVSALLADGVPGSSIIQVGISPFANSKEYADFARSVGIRSIGVSEARAKGLSETVSQAIDELGRHADAIYVDVDLDVLDRPLAPGTSGSRPGGLRLEELREALLVCGAARKVRAIDFVEFDPTRDVARITAYAGSIALLSFVSGIVSRATSLSKDTT